MRKILRAARVIKAKAEIVPNAGMAELADFLERLQ